MCFETIDVFDRPNNFRDFSLSFPIFSAIFVSKMFLFSLATNLLTANLY